MSRDNRSAAKWVALVAMTVALCPHISTGQNPPSAPAEPQLVAIFYYLDPISRELKPLPAERWTANGVFRFMKSIDVSDVGSPFHIANNRPEFVIQIPHPEYAKLFRFAVNLKSKTRRIELVKAHHGSRDSDPGIPTTIARFGERSFKLAPKAPLEAGEYALFVGYEGMRLGSQLFTFAVGEP